MLGIGGALEEISLEKATADRYIEAFVASWVVCHCSWITLDCTNTVISDLWHIRRTQGDSSRMENSFGHTSKPYRKI